MTRISPEIELHIHEKLEAKEKEYEGVFSKKWVEKAFTWTLYGVGAVVIAAVVRAVAPYLV